METYTESSEKFGLQSQWRNCPIASIPNSQGCFLGPFAGLRIENVIVLQLSHKLKINSDLLGTQELG